MVFLRVKDFNDHWPILLSSKPQTTWRLLLNNNWPQAEISDAIFTHLRFQLSRAFLTQQ